MCGVLLNGQKSHSNMFYLCLYKNEGFQIFNLYSCNKVQS